MAQTTWKQVVLDTADAYREANGTADKIPVGQLADKVRAGAGIPYEGDNPLTIGQAGYTFPAKTLLKDGLQIINGVNGEDLTDTAADQTTAVANLLKMVGRKIAMNNGEGQYVWKKYEYEQVLASEIIVTQIQGGGVDACIIKFSSDKIDFSTIDDSFFVGMKLTYTGPRVVNLYANNVAGFESSTSGHSWTWNPSTQQMKFSFTGSSNATWTITNPDSFGIKNITGYVVSADTEAYPDGAVQDGYWYELVEEGMPTGLLGCTKYAVDKFTLSARTEMNSHAIKHSLNDIPKIVYVFSKEASQTGASTGNTQFSEGIWIYDKSASANGGYGFYFKVNTATREGSVGGIAGVTNTEVYLYLSAYGIKYQAGIEFTVVTMA